MTGDRRANEFWYQFDEATLYNRSAELTAAFEAIEAAVGERWERAIFDKWMSLAGTEAYPNEFIAFVTPIKDPLRVLSQTQLSVMDTYYRRHDPRLVAAFSYFGQGVLYDPRRTRPVHTMNGNPPPGYHIWHIFLRAMMFLGIDRRRWAEIAPLNAFAWAVQTVAKPSQTVASEPLPRATVARLAATWLPRSAARLDTDFQSYPYPEGMS